MRAPWLSLPRFAAAAPPPVANGPEGTGARFGLDQDLELHDAYHVEVKRDYPVSWAGGPGSYVVETYIFLPNSFGIGPDTFPADQLFTLTQTYLRWKDDDFTFEEFIDSRNDRSPLTRLERGIKRAFEVPGPTLALAHEARTIGCASRVYLKAVSAQIIQGIQTLELTRTRKGTTETAVAKRIREDTALFLDRADVLLERVRAARVLAQQGSELLHPDVVQATRLVDEYLSSVYDQVLAQVFLAVKPALTLLDGQGGQAALVKRLKDIARRESVYRARAAFCSLDVEQNEQRELYGFKMSLLKKYVSKPLYLDVTATRPKPTALQHVAGAFAAALAAVWAVWVQMYLLANAAPPSGNGPYPADTVGKTTFSAVTSALFAAAVLAYVLKDRIKVLLNETIMRRIRGKLPDRDVYLSQQGPDAEARAIGRIREQARFVPLDKVPADVTLVRSLGHSVDLGEERLENVLCHRRSVELEAAYAHSPTRAVRDILRLNVAPFLERLADPDQAVHHFDERIDTFVRRTAPRVYHLNLVFRLAPLQHEGPVRYERIRVVLSQRGINRVEEAVPLGTLDEVRSRRLLDSRVAGGILDLPI